METVAYGDLGVSQLYDALGEIIILGRNSPNDLTKHFLKPNPRYHGAKAKASYAMVTTASGNTYIFGRGQIINVNNKEVFPFPKGDLVVRVGKALHMPGIATTSTVKAVEVEMIEPLSKTTQGGAIPTEWANADRQVDAYTPFNQVREALVNAQTAQVLTAPAPLAGSQVVRF